MMRLLFAVDSQNNWQQTHLLTTQLTVDIHLTANASFGACLIYNRYLTDNAFRP